MKETTPATVDEYIALFPEEVAQIMNRIRAMVRELVPEATEKISYQMPGYFFHGPLVYFAGYKKHIGFYPTPSGIAAFEDRIQGYKWAKGSVQFPLNQPIPYELIRDMILFKYEENSEQHRYK